MADNLIQVGAVVDLGQYKAGMQDAVATTERTTQQMSAAMGKHTRVSGEALGGLKLALEDSGIAVNRHVARFLAGIPGMQAFAAALPIVAVISLADSIGKAIEKHGKLDEAMEKLVDDAVKASDGIRSFADQLRISNLRLEDEIATLQKRPKTNGVALALAEASAEADRLTESIQRAMDADSKLLEGVAQGSLARIFAGSGDLQKLINETSDGVTRLRNEMSDAKTKMSVDEARHNEKDLAADRVLYKQKLAEYNSFLADQQAALTALKAKIKAQLTAESPDENTGKMTPGYSDAEAIKYVDEQTRELQRDLNVLQTTALNSSSAFQQIKKNGALVELKSSAENASRALQQMMEMQKLFFELSREEQKKSDSEQKTADADAIAGIDRKNKAFLKSIADRAAASEAFLQGEIKNAQADEKIQEQLIEQRYLKGQLNQQQEISLIAKAKQAEIAVELAYEREILSLWHKDEKEKEAILARISNLTKQAQLIQTKAVTDGIKAQEQQYHQLFSQIGSALSSNVLDVLKGTETVAQGFQKMYQSLIGGLIDYIAKKAEKMAEDWLIDKLFSEKKITSETAVSAGVAAMSGFASAMKALPFPINVATAPGVAAAAGAAVSGIGAGAAGAAALAIGTDYVPMDGLAYLHKGEKVIPAGTTGPGYSGGGQLHVHFSVSAIDADGVKNHLDKFGHHYADKFFKLAKRKGYKG